MNQQMTTEGDGYAGAQAGMLAAITNANRAFANWSERAAECFTHFVHVKGDEPFMTEDVRVWAEDGGLPPPPDRRAWGAVASAVKKAGLIKSNGYAPQKSPNSHGAPKTVWSRV